MHEANRRSARRARARQGPLPPSGERDVAGVGEFRAVAERILETGAHYLEQGREWLEAATTPRSDERMNSRRHRSWSPEEEDDGDRYRGARGHDRHTAGPWSRYTPRGEGYAPDEYAYAETGGLSGSGYAGYDYEDLPAREYDRRADELARDHGRQGSPYRATPHRPEAHGSSRQDDARGGGFLPGTYGYGGEGRRQAWGAPEPPGFDYSRFAQEAGFDEASRRWERAYEAQGYRSQRGRGPRGYTRSDERILEDVSERLSEDPVVDATDIDVRCESGRIVLEGRVPTRWMKHRAEDIADSIRGASDVENRLRVLPADVAARTGRDRPADADNAGGGSARSGSAGRAAQDSPNRETAVSGQGGRPSGPVK